MLGWISGWSCGLLKRGVYVTGRKCDPADNLLWSRGRERNHPPGEEGLAQTTCDELTAAPIAGEEEENVGKLSMGRRAGWGKDVLRFFFFLLSYSYFIGNKYFFSPE